MSHQLSVYHPQARGYLHQEAGLEVDLKRTAGCAAGAGVGWFDAALGVVAVDALAGEQ